MAITYTKFHVIRVLFQIERNLTGMQRDMRNNALTWKSMAQAQSRTVETIRTFMTDAGASYQERLEWIRSYRDTSPNWTAVTTMYSALGGDMAEATTLYQEMKSIADRLVNQAPLITTYAQIINGCDQILADVQPPDSLWPE